MGVRLRAISAVRPASLFALASLALAAVLFAIPADRARAHDDSAADYHNANFPLIKAVKADDLDSVNHFIDEHEEDIVNDADFFGETPLHAASNAATGHVTIAATLIAAGANVNATDIVDETPLHWAAEYGHASIVSLLIAATASLNLKNKNEGRTPLYMAARNGHVFVVSMLIAAKASLDVQGAYGQTPLHQAANYGRVTIADMLIAAGASLNVRSSGGDTPLYWAVFSNEVSIASALIAAGADVHAGQTVGLLWTPLLLAASKGRASIADMLIAEGATLDARDVDNNTPLHLSAGGGHAAMVSLLIQATASLNAENDEGERPLHLAVAGGHSAIVADLIAAGAYWGDAACGIGEVVNPAGPTLPCLSLLHPAVRRGDFSAVSTLIAAGAEVDARDDRNNTALHLAADAGRAAMVSLLIQATASLNAENDEGERPLHLAVAGGHSAIVADLIAAGGYWGEAPCASEWAVNPAGPAPSCINLHQAVTGGHLFAVNTLIAAGVDVNVTVAGKTPLRLALDGGHSEIAVALVAAGAYWGEAPCGSGSIANPEDPDPPCLNLIDAATNGHLSAVNALIAGGATVDVRDENEYTPLHWAARRDHVAVVNALIAGKADVDARDENDRTPLHWSASGGKVPAVIAALLAGGATADAANKSGERPLHVAMIRGRISMIAALITGGAAVDVRDNLDDTPLHWAAGFGDVPAVTALIAAKASLNVIGQHDLTPLGAAHDEGHGAAFTVILEAGGHWGTDCGIGEVVNSAGPVPPCLNLLRPAVIRGDFSAVSTLLAAGADADAQDANNNTPLHLAVDGGHAAIVSLLIQATASLNVKNNDGEAPLHLAADGGYTVIVSLLIQATASLNAENDEGERPLHLAVAGSHSAIVADLIAAGAYWGDAACGIGEVVNPAGPTLPCLSLLHPAVRRGDFSAVSTLIAAGADVDARDDRNNTALHLAADAGRAAMVSLLIQATASLNVKNNGGAAPLHLAANAGHVAVVSLLIQATASLNVRNNTGETPLHLAVFNRKAAVVDALIAAGADLNLQTNGGRAPLHYAVSTNDLYIVNALIAGKADVNARIHGTGNTPLWWAIHASRSAAIINALIAAGAYEGDGACESGLVTNPGRGPHCINLHQAAGAGYLSAVAMLIATGATLDAQDDDGDTPLHVATRGGHAVIASLLIQATASLNVQNDEGRTPLHLAVGGNHAGIVAALLAAKADVNLRNSDENTPLHWAHFLGRPAFVADLIAAGGYWGDAACESGDIVNPAGPSPPCLCEPPTVGTAGNCAAPSAESCGGLDPEQFYDAEADACVLFVECDSGEVVYKDVNDCHAPSDYPLIDAVRAGDLDLVNHFITVHMLGVNDKNNFLWAPLHYAAGLGHVPIVTALIAAGAIVDVRNDSNATPLHRAVSSRHISVVATLLAERADVNARNYNRRTPLSFTRGALDTAIVALLIAEGGHWGTDCASIGEAVNPAANVPPCIDLHQAATGGHVFAVATLIATGATLDAQDGDGDTPLHAATRGGHAAVVSLLIQATASLNVKNNDGDTPLHAAADGGRDVIVSLLIQATASLNVKNNNGDTPLHAAAEDGHAAVVSLLIQATASLNVKNDDDKAPLHVAAEAGHAAIVADLIAAGGYWGDAACESGEIVNPAGPIPPCLCEPPTVGTAGNCAAPSAESCGGLYPEQFYDAEADVCVMLVTCGSGEVVYKETNDCHAPSNYPLHDAVFAGDLDLVNHFITVHGSDVNEKRAGQTPLHFAARYGRASIAAALIAATANVNAETGTGDTPLHVAVTVGHAAIVSLLIQATASLNVKNDDDKAPLHLAAEAGHAAIVALLVEAGAYWGDTACAIGLTANPAGAAPPCLNLHQAVTGGHVSAVAALIAAKADVDAQDEDGRTPLHLAVRSNHAAIVDALLAAKANVNLQDKNGSTPLHWANTLARSHFFAKLIAAGGYWGDAPCAIGEVANSAGPVPPCLNLLHPAVRRGDFSAVSTLIAAGADVNVTVAGKTPLRLALDGGHSEIAVALIAAGGHWGTDCASIGEAVNPATNAPPCIDLHQAATRGHVFAVATLIATGATLDAQDGDGNTPLHLAVDGGHAAIVSLLIAATASLNVKNDDDKAPLHAAVTVGHAAVADALIAAGATLDAQDGDGNTPLHLAVDGGRAAIVSLLIAATASLNVKNDDDKAPLHLAVDGGHAAIADALIAAGAVLDARAANGNTPLHLAADGGRAVMVSLLIAATASLNVKNDDDKAPLHLAADGGHAAIVTELIAAGAYWGDAACGSEEIVNPANATPPCLNLLHQAVTRGDFSAVRALLAAGVDADARDANNNTALHLAADTGRDVMVSLLIQATASLNVQNNDGDTPLHLSAESGHVTVVSLLIQATASLNVKNNTYGDTPLHAAAYNGHAAIVDALIAAGAGVNEQNNDDRTPLHFGVRSSNVGIVDALIAAKASVNVKDVSDSTPLLWAVISRRSAAIAAIIDALIAAGAYWGDAPCESGLATNPANSSPPCIDLHQAVRGGHQSAVAMLIATGATVDAQDGDGDTPLHLAADGGHAVIVSLLIQATASLNVKNDDDKAPLHLAADGGHAAIVALLIEAGAYWGDAACAIGLTANPAGSVPPCINLHQAVRGGHVFAVATLIATGATLDAQDGAGDTPLHLAAKAGHAAIVSLLIQATASLNVQNNKGETPLHLAVIDRKAAVVDALIAARANLNLQTSNGSTPLHYAVTTRDLDLVNALIAAKANLNLKDSNGNTPLHWAQFGRSSAIIDALIAAGAYWGDAPCGSGLVTNPGEVYPQCIDLHQAAAGGHVFAVATLIARGATLDAQDDDNNTPLHLAADGGHAVIVSLLIQATASLNVKNDDEKAPLHLAADGGHAAIVALLVEAGAYWGDAACESGEFSNPAGAAPPCLCEPPTVRTLQGNCAAPSKNICGGLDPAQFYDAAAGACVLFATCAPPKVLYPEGNDCHAESDYPLHDAVFAGDLDLVNHFITFHMTEADVNVARGNGRMTPLHLAARDGHAAIAAALIAATANVNATNREGAAPLHLAAGGDHAAIVTMLIAATANVNARSGAGSRPLHFAVNRGYAAIVSLLIAATASVNVKNDVGETPLYSAVYSGYSGIVADLIDAGADVKQTVYADGNTPLHWAVFNGRNGVGVYRGGNGDIVAALLAAGATVNVKNSNDRTPLTRAAFYNITVVYPALIAAGAYWGDSPCESWEVANPAGPAPPCVLTAVNATLLAEVEKGRDSADAADAAVVAALLDEDTAHPDIKDADGRPLLILAARNGHAEIVSVLVTAGAEVNAADPVFRGFGAVHHAASALSGENAGGALGPWAARASVLYYFGGGLEVRNAASGDAVFVWNREDDKSFRPLDLLVDSLGDAADAAERVLLQEMADYLIAQGGECGVKTADRSQPACRGTLRGLLDEVEKATGAADVAVFSELLENRGADPDHADAAGRPLLILAARNGHAELVSILAVAGADVNATDPTFNNADVAHHLATPLGDPAAGPRGLRASVLRYFGGGLDVRRNTGVASAGFVWNREDIGGKRPLDLLADAEDESPPPAGEDVSVIYQMADYMLDRGANCGDATTNKGRRVCAGDPRFADARMSLLAEVKQPRGAANATVVADLLGGNFVGPDIADSEGTPILIVAATLGHAEIVSVLVTAGADPDARLRASICGGGSIGRAVPHVTARNNFGSSLYYTWGTAFNVLRHFADAVNQVGARYDWNARGVESDCVAESRALDYLRPRYDNDAASLPSESLDAKRAAMEGMAGVLVDNDASCENQANEHHVTCVGPLPAVTVGYGENPRDQSGGTLSAPVVSGETTPYGTSLTFTAAPANGWKLSAWAGDAASCPSSELECALPAIGDLRVTALFARAPRALHASEPSNGGQVTVTGADGVAEGADFVYTGGTVTFTAIPANGWRLSAWAGDAAACPSSGLECALTANGDLRVTALFTRIPRALHASEPSNGGRVTVTGADGVAEGADFVYTGGTVTFTAIPANGWRLSAWAGDAAACPSSGLECALTANGDLRVTALFSRALWALYSSDESRGRVTVIGTNGMIAKGVDVVSTGEAVVFTAIPANGWSFSAWTGDCARVVANICALLVATQDISVGATFADINECAASADNNCAAEDDGGLCTNTDGDFVCSCAVGYSGDGMTCRPDKTVSFLPPANGTIFAEGGGATIYAGETAAHHGTTVTFIAAPAFGYRFSAWLGDCAGDFDLSCEVAATVNISVGAVFTNIGECVTSEDCAADGGRCDDAGGVFDCVCDSGYSGDGMTCEADKVVSFQQPVNGTLSAAGAGDDVQDGETVTHGTRLIFTAKPNAGWRVDAWLGACAATSATLTVCEVAATLDVSAGAAFADINECATSADNNCAADGGQCANTAGGFTCSCAAGYSGDGRTCEADKAVSFLPSPNGTISAAGGGVSFQDGKTAAHGTTITFTAAPAAGFRFSGWFGDCAGAASCEVAATLDVSVGATFTDIDECATSADNNCAAEADGGLCANTAGGFTCSCAAGYSGDGRACEADKAVSFLPSPNGTISAAGGGVPLQDGKTAAHGMTITLVAAPDAGWQVSMWTGACAGTSVDASASRAFCEVVATAHINAGAIFTYIGRCATPGHLIFGAPLNRRCAPPTICPANYAGDNDCLPAAPVETGSPAPDLPAAANEPDACEKVFGGVMRSAGGGQAICSNVDRNDTFCIAGSRAAFPCRGLFRHVWKCNTYNRPALNPFFCGARCAGGANAARGRECGVETLDALQ